MMASMSKFSSQVWAWLAVALISGFDRVCHVVRSTLCVLSVIFRAFESVLPPSSIAASRHLLHKEWSKRIYHNDGTALGSGQVRWNAHHHLPTQLLYCTAPSGPGPRTHTYLYDNV
jgi:hypothetical protein